MTSSRDPLEPDEGQPLAGVRLDKLRGVKPSELGVRFVFGACASTVAAIIGIQRPKVGGMFLAFPAILPATLSLLEKKNGTRAACHDLRGAVLGSLGLVAFALVAASFFGTVRVGVVLAAAAAAWLVVSLVCYFLTAAMRRR